MTDTERIEQLYRAAAEHADEALHDYLDLSERVNHWHRIAQFNAQNQRWDEHEWALDRAIQYHRAAEAAWARHKRYASMRDVAWKAL